MLRPAIALALLASSPACRSATPAPETPARTVEVASPVASASATAAPQPAPAPTASPAEELARDLMDTGKRIIGYSATKKSFVVPIQRVKESKRGLSIGFFDEEGRAREFTTVCYPGECDEKPNDLVKVLTRDFAERFEAQRYEAIPAIRWDSRRGDIVVGSIGLRLRYENRQLISVLDNKTLPVFGGHGPWRAITALFPVPAAKLLGVLALHYHETEEFFLYKLP